MAGEETADRMFISLNESDELSKMAASQIKDFFESWGIHCFIAQKHTELEHHDDFIPGNLSNSNFFLQLINNSPRTRWMNKEWDIAQYLHGQFPGKYNLPIVFSTDKIADFEGKCCNALIGDEKRIGDVIARILNKRNNKDKIGSLNLPACLSSKKPEINLFSFINFVGNFKPLYERGAKRIYPDRKSIEEYLKNKFIELGEQKKKVRMLGFTLKRYVMPVAGEAKAIGSIFKSTIEKGATARLLLLDRTCTAAYQRSHIESQGKHEESLLVTDSLKVAKEYTRNVYKDKVEIGYYQTPYFGIILFEDEAFVEIYNLGNLLKDRELCGQVPIMLIRSDSSLYQIFETHFENMWQMWEKKYQFCTCLAGQEIGGYYPFYDTSQHFLNKPFSNEPVD